MTAEIVEVFVNLIPFPTFKLRRELPGRLATSNDILTPGGCKNYGILEYLEGKALRLDDGIFVLVKFKCLGDYEFDIELRPYSK